jgi:prolyl oligopeptidase
VFGGVRGVTPGVTPSVGTWCYTNPLDSIDSISAMYATEQRIHSALGRPRLSGPVRLGIIGGSNGGLLMGVEFTQHPEMWNAVVIQVPLLDMLGFEHLSAGASWVGEYGSVSVPEERAFLASISPYNQLKPDVQYPEPLIFTTTKDDRVGPVHARTFAARLEEFHKPFFYDEITEGAQRRRR